MPPSSDPLAQLASAMKASVPNQLPGVQLATLTGAPPSGPEWIHEIKLDGYRMRVAIRDGSARVVTRNDKDWTDRFPHIVEAALELPVTEVLLDGEVVVLAENGTTDFNALQNSIRSKSSSVIYFVFDILFLNGYDIRREPLEQRKQILRHLLTDADPQRIQFCDHIDDDGAQVFDQARRLGVEGIVSKRRDRPYRSTRSPDWLKIKCVNREEFIVVGFTPPSATRVGFGALALAHYDNDQLTYVGRVGTGFSETLLVDLRKQLDQIMIRESPLDIPAPRAEVKDVRWVKPQFVVQIEYLSMSPDGKLRFPAFQGIREDLTANQVQRNEMPDEEPAAVDDPAVSLEIPDNLRFTHPDRLIYPEVGVTKLGLAGYYFEIAKWMLPLVASRPLSLVRAPQGVSQKTFFQKHAHVGLPEAVKRKAIEKDGEPTTLLYVDDVAGLLSLVQFGVVEIHTWPAKIDELERPDQLWFDLDPADNVPWTEVVATALLLRQQLQDLNLESWVKLSGGKGLHIMVPITRHHSWSDARRFTEGLAKRMVADFPQRYTLSPSARSRTGRIYLDILRNTQGATTVAPYSTRARPAAPVSVPIEWDELQHLTTATSLSLRQMLQRVVTVADEPWRTTLTHKQRITAKAMRAVVG